MALADQIADAFTQIGADVKELSNTKVASTTVDTIWAGTQAAYDAIATKDPATLYVITEG